LCIDDVTVTSGSTVLAIALNGGAASAPADFCSLGTNVYFQATRAAEGAELWKYDTVTDTPSLFADLCPGASSSTPTGLTVFNSFIYFSAQGDCVDVELWRTDGINAPTLVANINPSGSSNPQQFLAYSSRCVASHEHLALHCSSAVCCVVTQVAMCMAACRYLLFQATTAANGAEMFRYDGSTVGLVHELNAAGASSSPAWLTQVGDKVRAAMFYLDSLTIIVVECSATFLLCFC
jgi:ELWxxDGT repeat protein